MPRPSTPLELPSFRALMINARSGRSSSGASRHASCFPLTLVGSSWRAGRIPFVCCGVVSVEVDRPHGGRALPHREWALGGRCWRKNGGRLDRRITVARSRRRKRTKDLLPCPLPSSKKMGQDREEDPSCIKPTQGKGSC